MNGYEKMKKLRRMKAVKIVSTITALSMTVTGLAIAASANEVRADAISSALGDLTHYGIVTGEMRTASHFESSFAVNKLTLSNNFDIEKFVTNKSRTITFSITTEEEDVSYYFGVYAGDERIAVAYNGDEKEVIGVHFDEAGTKSFVVNVPADYRYAELTVYQLSPVKNEDGEIEFVKSDNCKPLETEANDDSDLLAGSSHCIIAEDLVAYNEVFSSNKIVYVGSELNERIKEQNDGRWALDGNIVANNSNTFIEMPDASDVVNGMLATLQDASDALAQLNTSGSKSLYLEFDGSIYANTAAKNTRKDNDQPFTIVDAYQFIKDNPSYVLLVNVNLNRGENEYVFNGNAIGDWDADAASRIVFNFISPADADVTNTTVKLGDGFRGTALAANAKVENISTICGAVYAPEYAVGNGELHMASYASFDNRCEFKFFKEPEVTTTTTTTTEATTTTTEETTTTTTEVTSESGSETTTTVPETTTTTTEATTTTTTEATTTTTTQITTTTTTTEVTTTTPQTTTTTTPQTTTTTPVVTTTTTPVVTTTTPQTTTTTPVVTTTTTPVVTTTTPVTTTTTTTVTTTPPPETTTTTTEEITTTTIETEETTTTTPPEEVTTVTEEEITTTVEETTTTVEEPTVTTTPPATTTPPVTTVPLFIIEEDIPTGDLIIIDEDIPLGDLPMNTGVDNNMTMFMVIGGAALSIGVGAQVYTVILKKKK